MATQTAPVALAPGGALPPEVIRMIVGYLATSELYAEPKKGLARCSLTCRYWAGTLRPALFAKLTLCTPRDVSQLLDLLDAPSVLEPTLQRCLREVTYEILETQMVPPWLRLHTLSRSIPNVVMILTIGDAFTSHDDIDGASLLANFPRTLPPSIFPFNAVYLTDVNFKSAAEFSGLFHNMLKLSSGVVHNLTIRKRAVPVPRRALRQLRAVELEVRSLNVGSNSFSSQYTLARTILLPDARIKLSSTGWASAASIIDKLVPSEYDLSLVEVDEGNRGSNIQCTCSIIA